MITAREALDLASPTEDDIDLARKALKKIEKHLRTKMTFAGISDAQERANIIAYLKTAK